MSHVTLSAADIVIVGAGHSGGAAALALRELGFEGSVTLVGAEQHLPHERPPLSKEALQSPEWDLATLESAEGFAQRNIDLFLGERVVAANASSRSLTLASGRVLTYTSLVIATGAVPRRLAGALHPARYVLRTFDDAIAIRRGINPESKVVIIGGGPIGLEAASALRPQVAAVTVVEAAPRLMSRSAPSDIAGDLAALHEAHGVRICLSSPIAGITPEAESLSVDLASGLSLRADLVIEGLGVVPDMELARMLDLPLGNGILVDEVYATRDPHIYAIGDCACPPGGRRETWANAESSARAAARSLLGLPPEPVPTPYFWTDQYGSRLQVAGDSHDAAVAGKRGDARLYCRDGLVTAVAAFDAPRDFAAARRLIGQPV